MFWNSDSSISPRSVISSSMVWAGTWGKRLWMASTEARVLGWETVTRERFTATGTTPSPASRQRSIWLRAWSQHEDVQLPVWCPPPPAAG